MSARFPNVPIAPGVPAVFRRDRPLVPDNLEPLTRDEVSGAAAAKARWGVFDKNGAIVLEADSVVGAEFYREFRISDYPTEEGDFRSYNKVATPAETRVTLAKGGNEAQRAAFLVELDKIIASTDLYSFVTPDGTYLNRNVVRYDMMRKAQNGATLLTVELTLQEIRTSAAAAFTASRSQRDAGTAPKAVSGADTAVIGTVQPATPPASIFSTPAGLFQ